MNLTTDWKLDPENRDSKKLNDIITAHAKKLYSLVLESRDEEIRYQGVYAFYRKYYTLTLCKSCLNVGINKSPTRDIILDFPWKELKLDRIRCLKIWEKINH